MARRWRRPGSSIRKSSRRTRPTGRAAGNARWRAERRTDRQEPAMSALSFERLGKSYGDDDVVTDVSLTIKEGEFVSLLGPSGCGKTTILRMVAGLVAPSRGRILLGTEDVTALPPNKRGLGLVFQSYALFPHLTVFENVAFGLRRRKVAGAELDRRVKETLAMVRLDD